MVLNYVISWPLDASAIHPNLTNKRDDNGPNELADVLLALIGTFGSIDDGGLNGWLTEAGIRDLVKKAFFASLATEESRYPRCSLFWSIYPHAWFDTWTCQSKIELTVENIRRLAPICQNRSSAIRVALHDGELALVGMTALRLAGMDFFRGYPGYKTGGREINTQIHILAPGHLRVCYGSTEFELRAGRIRPCPDLFSIPAARELAEEFGLAVGSTVISRLNLNKTDSQVFGGLERCWQYEKTIELILRPILEGGHGGAVVVIPKGGFHEMKSEFGEMHSVEGLDLFERCVEHVTESVKYHLQPEPDQDSSRVLQSRGRFEMAATALGQLSSIDGCVLIDRSLNTIGFGAKILTTRDRAVNSHVRFVNAKSDSEMHLDELEQHGGTRWSSALWLCKACPNVLAFVVSQDQEIKVIWSENETAFAFGPVALPTIP